MREMKTVTAGRARIIHVEHELGIVNVYVGLHNSQGQRVVTVEMLPNQYAGEPNVEVVGNRFIEMEK